MVSCDLCRFSSQKMNIMLKPAKEPRIVARKVYSAKGWEITICTPGLQRAPHGVVLLTWLDIMDGWSKSQVNLTYNEAYRSKGPLEIQKSPLLKVQTSKGSTGWTRTLFWAHKLSNWRSWRGEQLKPSKGRVRLGQTDLIGPATVWTW